MVHNTILITNYLNNRYELWKEVNFVFYFFGITKELNKYKKGITCNKMVENRKAHVESKGPNRLALMKKYVYLYFTLL